MKLKCLAFLFVLCHFTGFSFPRSWHTYYSHINNAEQFICKGNIRGAYKQYKLAFAINDKNISNNDLYNSFHTAITVNDTVFAKKQLHVFLRRNVSQKFIDKDILGYYNGTQLQCIQQWVNLYKNDTIVLSETGLYVDRLITRDQDVRRNATGSKYYGGKGADSIDIVDGKVSKELFNLLQRQLLSIDSTGNYKHSPFSAVPYSIIISHNIKGAEMGKMDFLFWDVIIKGMEQYCFTPRDLLSYASAGYQTVAQKYMGAKDPLMFDCVGFNDSLFIPKMNNSKIGSINLIRNKYGLCTIEEEIVKINYANKVRGKSRFHISGAMRILDTEERNELNDWLNKTIYPN